jgi:hypothetical protein
MANSRLVLLAPSSLKGIAPTPLDRKLYAVACAERLTETAPACPL